MAELGARRQSLVLGGRLVSELADRPVSVGIWRIANVGPSVCLCTASSARRAAEISANTRLPVEKALTAAFPGIEVSPPHSQ
jgi:hypothetical protein